MAISQFPSQTYRTIDFTTSGTFTVPANVYSAEFLVVGAGGGGGGAESVGSSRSAACGGGGGGGVKKVSLATTPGAVYTITIGAKGLGATNGQAAGGAGGSTEVILSGTTLIKCFGGQGAASIDDATIQLPAVSITLAGGAGGLRTGDSAVGGGGGAGSYNWSAPESTTIYGSADRTVGNFAVEGIQGKNFVSSTGAWQLHIVGTPGIDGFGSGGGGAFVTSTGATFAEATCYGAGAGGQIAVATTNAIDNGSSATIAGCGGGGGAMRTTNSAVLAAAGGDGADGLVRITYYG